MTDDTPHPIPSPTPHLHKTHLNEAIVRATLSRILPSVFATVADVPYRLVGTAATLLHGIALPAGDIDLLFHDRQGVELFANALSALPTVTCQQPPTWLPGARQYFARYISQGVNIELSTVEFDAGMADWHECVGRGPWEYFTFVNCGTVVVPTVAVELRLLTELSRNRPDHYRPILNYLQTHRGDLDLVQRGMIAHQLPSALQREVIQTLHNLSQEPGHNPAPTPHDS